MTDDVKQLIDMVSQQALLLDLEANILDGWVSESLSGGWSTHQVKANEDMANRLRRSAAKLRAVLAKDIANAP